MNPSAAVPGSNSWRVRFLVHRQKNEPLVLRVHDSLLGIDYFFRHRSEDDIRHHVNQLRAGYTDIAPDGLLTPYSHAGS